MPNTAHSKDKHLLSTPLLPTPHRASLVKPGILARCLLAALLAIGLAACEQSAEETTEIVKLHLRQSDAYRERGQYRAATIEARNAIQKMPEAIEGYIAVAKIYNDLGVYRQAIAQLEQLPELAHSSKDYLVQLASAYNGRGKFRSALELLEKNAAGIDSGDQQLQLLKANALAGLGDYSAAETIYAQLIQSAPDSTEPVIAMARLYAAKQNIEQARHYANQASAVDTDSADIHFLQAQLSIAQGDLESAEMQLSDAIASLPAADTMTLQKSAVIRLLANVLTNMGKTSEALVYTRMLAEAFPGSDVAAGDYREASRLYSERKFAEASEILTRLVNDFPNYEDANVLLAIIKYHMGDNEAAASFFENNLDPETSHEEITRLAAIANIRNQNPEKVIALLEDSIDDTNDVTLLSVYGVAALFTGRAEEGEQVLNRALAQDSSQVKLYVALARYYNKPTINQREKALAYLLQGYENNPGSPLLASHLTNQYVQRNQIDKAQAIVDERLQVYPDSYRTQMLAGDFNASQDKRQKATSFYLKAHELQPKDLEPIMKLATNYMLAREYDKAINSFMQAADLNTDSVTPFRGVLGASKLKGDTEHGVGLLDSHSDNAPALLALSEFFVQENDIARAKTYRDKLASLAPGSVAAKSAALAISYSEMRNSIGQQAYDDARALALQSLSLEPDSPPLITALAEIEIKSGNHTEAFKLINQIETMSVPVANELRGDLHLTQQDPALAATFYQKAWLATKRNDIGQKLYDALRSADPDQGNNFLDEWLASNPDNPTVLSIKGAQLIMQEDYRQATQLLERARTALPGSVQVLNNLAWAYAQLDDAKAIPVAEEAYRLAPGSGAVADTYGWILFKQGQVNEAVSILEKAAALAPDNEEITGHLQQARAAL